MVVETDEGLTLVDFATAMTRPLVAAGDMADIVDWAVIGRRLYLAEANHVTATGLDGDLDELDLSLAGNTGHICAAADADILYTISAAKDGLVMERWSAAEAVRLAEVAVPATPDSKSIYEFFDPLIFLGRADRMREISCDASRLTVNGLDSRLVWHASSNALVIEPITPSGEPIDPQAPVEAPGGDPAPAPSPTGSGLTHEALASARIHQRPDAVTLIDPASGAELFRTPPLESKIETAIFVPRLSWVVTGLENGGLRVWDATEPISPVISINAHEGGIGILDGSPSGHLLLTGDSGGRLRVWPGLSVEELLARYPAP